jgi:hypothetical protein
MGSVRNPAAGAWVLQGRFSWVGPRPLTKDVLPGSGVPGIAMTSGSSLGVTVWDLFFVGLTIVIFAVLILIVKGIETFER